MTVFFKSVAIAGLMCSAAGSAFAGEHEMDVSTMTCSEFAAMDEEGQMSAMESMKSASMEGDASATDSTTTGTDSTATGTDSTATEGDDAMMQEEMTAMMSACEGNDDMMAMDAMKSMESN